MGKVFISLPLFPILRWCLQFITMPLFFTRVYHYALFFTVVYRTFPDHFLRSLSLSPCFHVYNSARFFHWFLSLSGFLISLNCLKCRNSYTANSSTQGTTTRLANLNPIIYINRLVANNIVVVTRKPNTPRLLLGPLILACCQDK